MGVLDEGLSFLCDVDKAVIFNVFPQVMEDEGLVDDRPPEAGVMVTSCAKKGQGVMVIGLDKGIADPGKDAGQVLQLEVLRQGLYELYHQA